MERASNDDRKTNKKGITPTNHNRRNGAMNQSELPTITGDRVCKVRLILVLLLIGEKTGVTFFSQSPSVAITIVCSLSGAI